MYSIERTPRQRRTFVQEQLLKADWQKLADRSCPYPVGVTAEDVLKHFGQMMLIQYNEKYGSGNIIPRNS